MSKDHRLSMLSVYAQADFRERALTLPNLLAIEDATIIEAAEMMLLAKKIDPSFPSGRLNLSWKKKVIQELYCHLAVVRTYRGQGTHRGSSDDSNESRANRTDRWKRISLLSALISGSNDLNRDFFGTTPSALFPSSGAVSGSCAIFFSASHALLRPKVRQNLITPKTA